MRTVCKTVYLFSELSEQAKKEALDWGRELNVDFGWWENTYEKAYQAGLEITGFNIDQGSINGELTYSLSDSCQKIIENHNSECSTYKTAKEFQQQWAELVKKYSDGINTSKVTEDNEDDFDNEADDLERKYESAICTDYLNILREEYEYLTSDETIAGTIETNGYEFNEDGTRA